MLFILAAVLFNAFSSASPAISLSAISKLVALKFVGVVVEAGSSLIVSKPKKPATLLYKLLIPPVNAAHAFFRASIIGSKKPSLAANVGK